jgi:1-aminocyclopropane-1-carboxylate deaminase/D-cysteine desulfhydrase-like pyridoxal-dependent ACC family enzyme
MCILHYTIRCARVLPKSRQCVCLLTILERDLNGVFTRGFAGSNHVCATTLYAKECGLDCVCLFGMQRVTSYLRRNLKLDFYWGAEQHFFDNYGDEKLRDLEITRLDDLYYAKTGTRLYKITSGGSDVVGDGYAAISHEAHNAIKTLWDTEGIKLDGTYTGKTFAALLHDVETKDIKNKVIVFWDSFCSGSFDDIVSKIPYTALPKEFHFLYEMPIEEGDQGV